MGQGEAQARIREPEPMGRERIAAVCREPRTPTPPPQMGYPASAFKPSVSSLEGQSVLPTLEAGGDLPVVQPVAVQEVPPRALGLALPWSLQVLESFVAALSQESRGSEEPGLLPGVRQALTTARF